MANRMSKFTSFLIDGLPTVVDVSDRQLSCRCANLREGRRPRSPSHGVLVKYHAVVPMPIVCALVLLDT